MSEPNDAGCMVILVSEEEEEFPLPWKAAIQSDLVRHAVTDGDDEDDDPGDDIKEIEPIKMIRVNSPCLKKVVEFLMHHSEDPMHEIAHPLPADTFEQNVQNEWYQNFFDDESMPRDILFDVLRAANYMGIAPLLDLACLKITFLLNGKSEEEIREILNLPAMTPEEEERARREHAWIFEGN